MQWLSFFHQIADIVSTYAGLLGLSLQAIFAFFVTKYRAEKKKKGKAKKSKKNE